MGGQIGANDSNCCLLWKNDWNEQQNRRQLRSTMARWSRRQKSPPLGCTTIAKTPSGSSSITSCTTLAKTPFTMGLPGTSSRVLSTA